ncbi:preprotein translocase subunit YajC [Scardovia wiggsiae]|uniref:preprotein translocase subunit YajC n=1 Tax=Scardovia wiggsiae TaxID=230143 RepID=UPI003628A96F
MNSFQPSTLILLVLIILMIALMWWTSRKQRSQQNKIQDFRKALKPGDEVATVSGLLGTVRSVDLDHDEIVIDSEGSLSKWRIQAITEPPVRPAYISDDEVDEEGNPLPKKEDGTGQGKTDSTDTTPSEDADQKSFESQPSQTDGNN